MRALSFFLLVVILSACSSQEQGRNNFIFVKGGVSKNTKSNLYGTSITIQDFYIGKYEVIQKEWNEVMGTNPSKFKGDSLPVETVTWYDCIEYCIKRSEKEGLQPYYNLNKDSVDTNNVCEYDSLKYAVTINPDANGYRLPSEAEWEYAAGGGSKSKSYNYSGGNELEQVGWYWKNAGDSILSGSWSWPALEKNNNKTKLVGRKLPNELGIFDMSGNVREWCEDWYVDQDTKSGLARSQRGGGWMGSEYRCEIAGRDNFEATGKGPDQGFRVCRNK
jgi:formylglycine-generating enzyme